MKSPSKKAGKAGSLDKPIWWTSDEWKTPPSLINQLEDEFGKFDLDPCCREESSVAPLFFTKEQNGLANPWTGRVFLNPPYSNPSPWLEKAIAETKSNADLVVALLPSSTETRWFHNFVMPYAEIRFLRKRVRFIGWNGTGIENPKRANILAIYKTR